METERQNKMEAERETEGETQREETKERQRERESVSEVRLIDSWRQKQGDILDFVGFWMV